MGFNYNTWAKSWKRDIFTWGSSWGKNPSASKGGVDERDYKRYRKYLERLEKATAEEKIYPKRAIKAVQVLAELPVEAKEFKKIAAPAVTTGTLSLTPPNRLRCPVERNSSFCCVP